LHPQRVWPPGTAPHGGLEGISMTNKQLKGEYSMNHEQDEADRLKTELAGFIYDQALVTYTEMVSAGGWKRVTTPW